MSSLIPEKSRYLLEIIRAALNNADAPLPPSGMDMREVYELAEAQGLSQMAYHALYRLGLDESDIRPFQLAHRSHLKVSMLQEAEFGRISAAFEEAGMDYCPLKGWFTRQLYPDPTMRVMGDIDVLIRSGDSERAKTIMESLGYSCSAFMLSDDDQYRRQAMLVELHRTLESHHLKDASHYSDPWSLTVPYGGRCRRLEVTEEYVFAITHALKHFRTYGTGLRTLLDIHLLLAKTDIDRRRAHDLLEQMGAAKFAERIEHTAEAAFGDAGFDEVSAEIFNFMADSGAAGVLGNGDTAVLLRAGGESGGGSKLLFFLNRLFPAPVKMKRKYKAVQKAPVLLPFAYPYRWFELMFNKKDRLKKGVDRMMAVNKENAERLKHIHETAGIEK